MNGQHEYLDGVRGWITKASHDLVTAEHTLTLDDATCPFDTVCFHAQQCAEKILKAFLVYASVDFPHTHDLVILCKLAANKNPAIITPEQVQALNRYSVETRYPNEWEPITREEAETAVRSSKKVFNMVRSLLPENI